MTVQEQIEQLRAKVKRVNDFLDEIPEQYLTGGVPIYRHQLEQELARLAALEAQAAAEKADPHAYAKNIVKRWENNEIDSEYMDRAETVARYVRHLEAENKRLEAELARRPVVLYAGNRAYTYETYTGQQS